MRATRLPIGAPCDGGDRSTDEAMEIARVRWGSLPGIVKPIFGFHFGAQPIVTQDHSGASAEKLFRRNRLSQALLGYAG